MPFRVQFVRIPIYHCDQIISVWFNSAYPRPYRRRRSKLLFSRIINDPNDLSDESQDDEEDVRDALEEDFITNAEVVSSTTERLANCSGIDNPGEYNPQGDWKTYFRWDIPTFSVMQTGGRFFNQLPFYFLFSVIEDVSIIAPQQIFYHNNRDSLDPNSKFNL